MRHPTPGLWIAGIGVFHELAGLVLYGAPLAGIVHDGVWDTVMPQVDTVHGGRQAAFWFMVAGPLAILLGALAHWAEARVGHLPRWLGAGLLALTALGCAAFARSAFWLLLVPSLMILFQPRRTEAAA